MTAPAAWAESIPLAFPIVGMGTFADGLEAIFELLDQIGASIGMAFLVVPHLASTRHNLLSDILSKRSFLTVPEAGEGMGVDADHLYVIRPDTNMPVVQGHIKLRLRGETLGPPMPIDDLFSSLAPLYSDAFEALKQVPEGGRVVRKTPLRTAAALTSN